MVVPCVNRLSLHISAPATPANKSWRTRIASRALGRRDKPELVRSGPTRPPGTVHASSLFQCGLATVAGLVGRQSPCSSPQDMVASLRDMGRGHSTAGSSIVAQTMPYSFVRQQVHAAVRNRAEFPIASFRFLSAKSSRTPWPCPRAMASADCMTISVLLVQSARRNVSSAPAHRLHLLIRRV